MAMLCSGHYTGRVAVFQRCGNSTVALYGVTLDGRGAHMNSMLNPRASDPHEVAVAALAQDLMNIGRADEQFAGVDKQASELEQDAARHLSEQQDRPPSPGSRSSLGGLALPGFIGLLLAGCVAALLWQSSYGNAVKLIFTRSTAQRASTSSLPLEDQELPTQPSPATVNARADAALPQPATEGPTIPRGAAPIAAPMPLELEQWLRTIARDLASTEQAIQQLKTSQDQSARDNAELVEQLKAAQAQIVRDNAELGEQLKAEQARIAQLITKASEQKNLRPKTPAPPPLPTANPSPMRNRADASVAQPRVQPQTRIQLKPKQQ
jgi:hypothetical protein